MKTTITILATFLSLGLRAQTELATISDDVAQAGQASFELVSFVATPVNGDGVRLQWSTGSEAPNSAFHIQRSSDGANWRTVITQDGEGGGSGYSFYEVMDLAPEHGVTHYRLLALVPGQAPEYSDEFAVVFNPKPVLRIEGDGNPSRFIVQVDGTITDLQMLNNRGQFVPMTINYTGSEAMVEVAGMEPGTYYVQAMVDGTPVLREVLVTATGVIGG